MNTQNTVFSPAPADEMLNDIRYSKAQQLAKLMLSRGLLSPAEFLALTDINREALTRCSGKYFQIPVAINSLQSDLYDREVTI